MFFLVIMCVSIQAEEKAEAPLGMKVIRIGNVDHIVPEGTQVYRDEDGRITLEGRLAYISRKFKEIEEELSKLKEENKALKEEVNKLTEELNSTPDKQ